MTTTAAGVELLTASQVADMFRVDPKTVSRWASKGIIAAWPTPGGRRRYLGSQVRALAAGKDHDTARQLALADLQLLTGAGASA